MIWQDGFSGMAGRTDPEEERELRLAAQARVGAEWALSALVARYQPPVTRYLSRLSGNPDFARRAAEQIFVRMERRIRGPQGAQNLRLWLLRACTEAGLEFLRAPSRPGHAQLTDPGPAALLTERGGGAAHKLRAGLDGLANLTGTTGRQMRELIFPSAPPPAPKPRATGAPAAGRRTAPPAGGDSDPHGAVDPALDTQDPREALRHRLVRAVLAELPYGDAQCLALHLVAGLNQAQVARALGITPSAARRRIVQGLQLFAQRYEAAAAILGLPPEPEPEAEPEPEPVPAPAVVAPAIREVNDVADEPTRVLPTVSDSPGAATPDTLAAEAPAEIEVEQPWAPEMETVVEPRHEIIVDATPPETADVLDAAAAVPAESGPDADVELADTLATAAASPPTRRTEPSRVVEGTVAAVRVVPALTPLPLPEPQLPPEVMPASGRWSSARAIPVLTRPLPDTRSDVGPSFAAQTSAVRRVPVLTADTLVAATGTGGESGAFVDEAARPNGAATAGRG